MVLPGLWLKLHFKWKTWLFNICMAYVIIEDCNYNPFDCNNLTYIYTYIYIFFNKMQFSGTKPQMQSWPNIQQMHKNFLLQLTPLFVLSCDGQSNTPVCVSGHPHKQDICSYTSCQVPPCLQRSMMEENVTLSCL